MIRRPPRSTRTDTLFPCTTLFRSSCTDSFFANRSRPCLLYQIKRCSAPCVDRISKEDYAGLVSDAQDFLEGRSTAVQKRLGDAMTRAAEAMDYEQAAVIRDRLKSLTFIQGSQRSEERRVGKECVRTGRSGWSPYHKKKK